MAWQGLLAAIQHQFTLSTFIKKIIFLCGALKCPTKILYFPAFLVPRFGHMTKFWHLRLYVILIRGLIKGSGLF